MLTNGLDSTKTTLNSNFSSLLRNLAFGSALTFSSLASLATRAVAQSQSELQPNKTKHNVSYNPRTTSEQEIKQLKSVVAKVIPANVSITIQRELQPVYGSGTLLNIKPNEFPVLNDNEILIASASHLFTNWTNDGRITVTIFNNFNQKFEPASESTYPARLISRINLTDRRAASDVALVAVSIPADKMPEIYNQTVALDFKQPIKNAFGTFAVTTGCPGAAYYQTETQRAGANIKTLHAPRPIWQNARILSDLTSEFDSVRGKYTTRNLVGIADAQNGHSGGGLFNSKGQLFGVCSGNRSVEPGTVDFVYYDNITVYTVPHGTPRPADLPSDAIVVFGGKAEFDAKMKELMPAWARESTSRTSFTSSSEIINLMKEVASRYNSLLLNVTEINQHYSELIHDIRENYVLKIRQNNAIERLKRAWRAELSPINAELNSLKP